MAFFENIVCNKIAFVVLYIMYQYIEVQTSGTFAVFEIGNDTR